MDIIPVAITKEGRGPYLFFRAVVVLILFLLILNFSLLKVIQLPLGPVSILFLSQFFLTGLYFAVGQKERFATLSLYLALTLDALFASALIHYLELVEYSPFLILYALIILYAGLVLQKGGGIWIAAVSVAGYLGVWYYNSWDPSSGLEKNGVMQLFTTSGLMLLVGYASGTLGAKLREKSEALSKALTELDLYSRNLEYKNTELESQKQQIQEMYSTISSQLNELTRKNQELSQAHLGLKEAQTQLKDYAKNLENKVEEQTRMLIQSEKMASVGNLVAGVSHEMGSPLNVISFLVYRLKGVQDQLRDLSQRGESSTPQELEEIKEITMELESSFDAMYSVIQGLKEFAHKGSGKRERVDLHRSLDTVYRMVQPQYKGKVEVVKDYGEVPEVWGILAELNQAFINFLSNACQSIPDGKGGRVVIRTWVDGEWVKVSIQDNGSGIPQEDLSRIFDPYFTTKPMGKGLGLGLAITFQVIQRHQGRIEVKSEVHRGTEFVVSLPAAKEGEDDDTRRGDFME
ncbi:MAG: hypothetical protein HY538_01545 [Deltaproteobacteria bacterium]|nr:hypothetical protein [Deltaproteobacteria bacterium]